MKQIYFFNTDGRCIQRSSSESIGRPLRQEIDRHLAVLAEYGPMQTFVSDLNYAMNEIYFANGSLLIRQPNPATIDGMVLSNLPVPCTIIIKGAKSQWNDSELLLSFTYPGVYDVTVEAWPYLDRSFKVVAE